MNRRILPLLRTLYLSIALLAVLYLSAIVVSGVLWNHRQRLHLDQHYLTRVWLPERYHAGQKQVRADVVAGEAEWALLSSRAGSLGLDAMLAFWGLSLVALAGLRLTGRFPARQVTPPRPRARTIEMPTHGAKVLEFRRK